MKHKNAITIIFLAFTCVAVGQNVGIGTNEPAAALDVTGQIRMNDGSQENGNILLSDSTGIGSWVNPNDGIPLPDPFAAVPIRYQGSYLYVLPVDYPELNWDAAVAQCNNLDTLGHSDWYLPSRLELDAMYKQSYLIAGLSQTEAFKYWSSTEQDMDNAFTQRLDYGGPDPDPKIQLNSCRCVRLKD